MLTVNQMFHGTDEPVWLVDGTTPSPVKYHYLETAQNSPPRRVQDPSYLYEADPYYSSADRGGHYRSTERARSVRQPSYYTIAPSQIRPAAALLYSSTNPPPAPVVVPTETPISHTPLVPVVPAVPPGTPYTLLLKVPICCEGCERKVVKRLLKVPGVASVRCDIVQQRVAVRGNADTDEVLKEAKKAFKKSRLW